MAATYIFKSSGQYLGFVISDYFFSRDGIYLGWVESPYVWDSSGQFRGELREGAYILRNLYAIPPVPKVPKVAPPTPPLPPPPPNRVPIILQIGYVDAF